MSVYPTKTYKINSKSRKFKTGIVLTSIFSINLLLLIFNFFEIYNIFMHGVFGLIIYPISLFFIILGILLMCNKEIKTSKSILIFSIVWLIIFVLILQLATSKNIDNGFSEYIVTTFKHHLTAGGVIFATILYPLYYISYTVATYVVLAIALTIITAILIDKIYLEVKNQQVIKSQNKKLEQEIVEEIEDDSKPIENIALESKEENKDDDIFISDEEETEQREEAKSILGLYQNSNKIETKEKDNLDYASKLEEKIEHNTIQTSQSDEKKPNIFVHDDNELFETKPIIINKTNSKQDAKNSLDEERRKSALAYLNISQGKFETKTNQKKGIDNVKPKEEVWNNTKPNLDKKKEDNKNILNNITDKLNLLQNNKKESQLGINPFNKEENQKPDLYDENLTKENFKNSFEKPNINIPKKAQEVYSGEVNENIVETDTFRPIQVSMIEPTKKSTNTPKVYKKPPTYVKPPLNLLAKYSTEIDNSDYEYIQNKGDLIVETLKAFKIDTKIINAVKGPTFTRYELQMAPGISVNSVNSKVNDLSMALESPCRVQVPIPGKNAFGIEVPNKKRITVGLREILESENFQQSKSPLTFALGKDISGTCKVACIDKLVHTLVAGSTGSGKSVCLSSLLISLLYKASPEDLRLLIVDPKSVEFVAFNNLPHMLIPYPITDCEKAVSALNWLVEEMERRYKLLSSVGVKKISEFNESPEVISGAIQKMYYIVMIFDEVGDFMQRAKKEIEEKIILLASKSRACGIHLILATQRPTVDVITGTIKTNLSSRISFAVSSYNDSKTILESSGAEYLLGKGDMLFSPQGSNDLDRIQGCLIDNNEVKAITNFVKENNEADFDEAIEDQMFNHNDGFDASNGVEEAFDPLMKDCLRYFIKSNKCSSSSLRGYFGIGYPKANKIMIQMEKAGFVSPSDNNGRHTLYMTVQEFEERFGEDIDE